MTPSFPKRPSSDRQRGLKRVVRAKPDGYTLGVGQITNLALSTSVMKENLYDPQKDLVPVAQIAENYQAIVSKADGPLKTITDVIKWAKTQPLGVKLGSPSQGGLPHMTVALIARQAGFTVDNIAYKDIGPDRTPVVEGKSVSVC